MLVLRLPRSARRSGRTGAWVAALAVVLLAAPGVADRSPAWILDTIDDLYRGESARGTMLMQVKTEHWQREMQLEFWARGRENSRVTIVAPKKEKGTTTLRVGSDVWNYLPKVDRVIKVPASMMGGTWMGSHFTNDDLVKESRMVLDFDFRVAFQGERDGKQMMEIDCIPKPDAAVVWGRVVVEVERPANMPVRIHYYNEEGALARTMFFSEPRKIGDRMIPMLLRMVPADKPDEWTQVRYQDIAFDVELDPTLFTQRGLKR